MRSLGLLPESLSHDWHVQPSCQRPNRTPPERREFSPGKLARMRIRLSSKPYKHTVRRKILSTSTSHRLSTCFAHAGKLRFGTRAGELACRPKGRFLTIKPFGMTNPWVRSSFTARNGMVFRFGANRNPAPNFRRTPRRKTEIEKRSYVWRSFLKEPFGSVLFPNRSPVAGTDLESVITFLNI